MLVIVMLIMLSELLAKTALKLLSKN